MAEQFTRTKLAERRTPPGVDRVGDQLLAAAGLSLYEHGRGGVGGLVDLLLEALDGVAFPDDVVHTIACAPYA